MNSAQCSADSGEISEEDLLCEMSAQNLNGNNYLVWCLTGSVVSWWMTVIKQTLQLGFNIKYRSYKNVNT